jgi:hypothetical protein
MRRDVAPDGSPVALYSRLPALVLLQGFPRHWEPSPDWSEHVDVRLRLRSVTRDGLLVEGVMEYQVAGGAYVHEFRSRLLTDDELDEDLAACGLRRGRTLDERGSWIEALPG